MKILSVITSMLTALVLTLPATAATKSYTATSPDGKLKVDVTSTDSLRFRIFTPAGDTINACAAMKLENTTLGMGDKVKKVKRSTVDRQLQPVVPVKKSDIRDHYNSMTLVFGRYDVEFRLFDNGVAYRFITRLPDSVNVMSEDFMVDMPLNTMAHLQQPRGFKTSSEEPYTHKALNQWDSNDRMAILPSLFQLPEGEWMLVSESDLIDYPGMFLQGTAKGFTSVFPRLPISFGPDGDRSVKIVEEAPWMAHTSGTRTFPWRYMAFGTSADIATQTLTTQLSSPLEIDDPSWIRPGKAAWEWWNGASVYGPDVDFESGFNLPTYKYFIDFASRHGIEYIVLDEGWAKSTLDPYTPNPTVDVKELIRYGNERGVGIFLWLTWLTVENNFDLFKTLSDWGVKGLKIDFMDRGDQWMNNYLERVAKEAAKNKLLVDFHGAHKPSGLDIRYPNVLSYEGVRGMENMGHTNPNNSLWLPFMRNAVGPMDYTPGAMISMQPEAYGTDRPNSSSIGTRAYQMALFTVFESGLQMTADSPTMYYRNPECARFIAGVPTVWDETIVLSAEPGSVYAVAKRKGQDWYVAAIAADGPRWRDLSIDLDFLNPGAQYEIEWFEDGINAPRQAMDYRQKKGEVNSTDKIEARLARNGGWTGALRPLSK
ncbi:MAG: glycoside hydrolase family 97 protein [Clostridiales bacterium]|nr:glycoside hydrolase family 97 protein [Clostridiales bacterium]